MSSKHRLPTLRQQNISTPFISDLPDSQSIMRRAWACETLEVNDESSQSDASSRSIISLP